MRYVSTMLPFSPSIISNMVSKLVQFKGFREAKTCVKILGRNPKIEWIDY
jgi:hypothetical protein